MNLDGLTMSVLVKELSGQCTNKQIQRLTQIDKQTLLFKLSGQGNHADLIIAVGSQPACYMSQGFEDLAKEPTGLCLFLRKHLEGGRIVEIKQINDDRIIQIFVDKLNLAGTLESKIIYVELMGKYSNCIITENGMIIESLIHVTPFMSQERSIAPKLPYILPPNANRMSIGDFNAETLTELFLTYGNTGTVGQSIRTLFNGFGNPLLQEVCYRANIDRDEEIESLSKDRLKGLCVALKNLYEDLHASTLLYSYVNEKNKIFYSPILLTEKGTPQSVVTAISPLIEAEIQARGSMHTGAHMLLQIVASAIKKEKHRNAKIKAELNATKNMDLYKLYGDLLMIYAYLPHEYKKNITVPNLLSDSQEDITIPIKKELTVSENGTAYYKLYNKLKKRLVAGSEQLRGSTERIVYLESIQYSLEDSPTRIDLEDIRRECESTGLLKKTKKNLTGNGVKTPKILTIPLENGRILIGRNNRQNDYITNRLGNRDDLWFHTQKIHGSHVLLQTEGTPDEEEILMAAGYAAYYSKGRDGHNVPVDYTQLKFVKKPSGSPLGFVIYTDQNTVYVAPQMPPADI